VPGVTFAIPCRNGARHLRPLLQSLLEQTRPADEILLVDDASGDDSVALARDVAGARIRVHVNPQPLGLAGNWNRCVELCRTELLCLAHMDDQYSPDYLARLVPALEQDAAALLAHCRARAIDEAGRAIGSPVEAYKDRFWRRGGAARLGGRDLYLRLRQGNFVCCPSVLWRVAALRALGGFTATLTFAADWDLLLRAALDGAVILGVPDPLVAYRRHDASASRAAVASLRRHEEELDVIAAADRSAVARGWLRAAAPVSPAARNSVLLDAFGDLEAGDRGSARARLALLFARAPAARRDPRVLAFRAAAALGAPGRWLLRAGLRAQIALGP
jgi:glycosyltransferase involved in cell wall biosynthesis